LLPKGQLTIGFSKLRSVQLEFKVCSFFHTCKINQQPGRAGQAQAVTRRKPRKAGYATANPPYELVRKATPDKVLDEIKGTGGKILKTSLSHDDEAKLQAALSAVKK
jgi:hypothetical protein